LEKHAKRKGTDWKNRLKQKIGQHAAFAMLVSGLLVITYFDMRGYRHLRRAGPATQGAELQFLSAGRGLRRQTNLPDGSRVWLNAGTSLQYPEKLATGARTVDLSGEAYFEVASDAARPFLVRTRDAVVQVLGTRFDVRSYPEEGFCRTTVMEGAVQVSHGDERAMLRAGDQAEVKDFHLSGPAIAISSGVDSGRVTDWTRGFINFHDEDLTAVLAALSRAYDMDIVLDGPMPETRFFGSFSLQESPEDIVRRLDFHGLQVSIRRGGPRNMTIRLHS
jgi:transmembrane sensor